MRPLLITAIGRTISTDPLGRRDGDVELRQVPALPTAWSLDGERPTVIVLDRALLGSSGGDHAQLEELSRSAALVGLGEAGEREPPVDFPLDLLTGYAPADAPVGVLLATVRGAFRHAVAIVAERCAIGCAKWAS
jgi:hypothetical protein